MVLKQITKRLLLPALLMLVAFNSQVLHAQNEIPPIIDHATAAAQLVTPTDTTQATAGVLVEGQMAAADCGCMQPTCASCEPCECGQASCGKCRILSRRLCGGCGVRGCRGGCGLQRLKPCNRCPQCNNEVCISESGTEKEKRNCWKTEQKVICIPKIRFPWQKCDGPICGKTKTITLLKKHSYECEVCKYSWKLVEPELPKTTETTIAPEASSPAAALPPLPPANQTAVPVQKPYYSIPAASNRYSMQFEEFESKIIPANTPLIIQGKRGAQNR